jgi:hypothetical protein
MSPPKRNERRLCGATLKTAEVLETYYILLPRQVERGITSRNGEVKKRSRGPFHQQDERYRVRCSVPVDNSNLGGYSGRSALSGKLWCYAHADGSHHCCSSLGGVR